MTNSSFARPTIALLALAAIVGCGGAATTTQTAPAPAPTTTSTTTSTSTTATSRAAGLPAGVTAAMVTLGDSLFKNKSCQRCHGADAKGRQNGPDLTSGKFLHVSGTYQDFVRIITEGVPADKIKDKSHQFPMRARGGVQPPLTDDEVKAIAAYLYSLNTR